MIKDEKITLRPLKLSDAPWVLKWENNTANWLVSGTEKPYSIEGIRAFIKDAMNVRENRQLRLLINLDSSNEPIGAVDLFEINFIHKRAEVGILIAEMEHRKKGFGLAALMCLEEYAKANFDIVNFFCGIQSNNSSSIRLFEKAGYQRIGIRKNWYQFGEEQLDELLYQRIIE
jgi:diamine N-acetyltransferase